MLEPLQLNPEYFIIRRSWRLLKAVTVSSQNITILKTIAQVYNSNAQKKICSISALYLGPQILLVVANSDYVWQILDVPNIVIFDNPYTL